MRADDIIKMAHDVIDCCAGEDDHVEYWKSVSNAVKGSILKTACAYANDYMNREIGLLLIGIEKEADKEMKDNRAPELVFRPENDTDDYTS